jgi:DNA-directed RNA polymerase specialized sigma24 family protein
VVDDPEFLLPSPDLGPADQCVVREIRGQMDAALARLREQTSPENYELFYRRFRWGQSASEIAAALDLTPEEVRYRHYRLMRKWRKLTRRMALLEGDGDQVLSQGRGISRIPR